MKLLFWFACFLGIVAFSQCSKYLKLDQQTQSKVMKLGKRIFGQSADRKPKVQPRPNGMPNPAETWALWQQNVRQNTLIRQRKQKERKRNQPKKDSKNKSLESEFSKSTKGNQGHRRRTKTTKKPPGTVVSLTDMVSQFRRVLRTQSFGVKTRSERVVNNMSEMMAAGIPDILSGFAISTNVNIPLTRKTKIELHKYETNKQGAFLRGSAVNLQLGRFTVPATAVYSFHGTVHISLPKGMRDFARKDFVTASICIDGECRKNMAISSTSGLRSNSRLFSLNVSGYLYLEAHRFVSIFIINNSQKYDINIVRGSYFSGMLVGT